MSQLHGKLVLIINAWERREDDSSSHISLFLFILQLTTLHIKRGIAWWRDHYLHKEKLTTKDMAFYKFLVICSWVSAENDDAPNLSMIFFKLSSSVIWLSGELLAFKLSMMSSLSRHEDEQISLKSWNSLASEQKCNKFLGPPGNRWSYQKNKWIETERRN